MKFWLFFFGRGGTLTVVLMDHLNIMEAPNNLEEITQAIDHLKPNKAPGPDGLTAEFYKKF